MTTKTKKYGPWVYNPRPRDFTPEQHPHRGRLRKLETLAGTCEQDGDRVYRLPGTTFRMTLTPEAQARLDGTEVDQ